MPRQKKVEGVSDLEPKNEVLVAIERLDKTLNEGFKKLGDLLNVPKPSEFVKAAQEEKKAPTPVVDSPASAPVPLDWRNLVNETLNRHFSLEVYPRTDLPQYELKIIVPKKYSALSDEQLRNLGGRDERVKVIEFSAGANGVRTYAELVFNSFNPEVKSMIVADRD